MSVEAPPIARIQLGSGAVFQIWVRHLTSLLLPVSALAFLFTGPHVWYVSPLFMLPVVWAFVLDNGPQVEQRQPIDELPAWPFDALVYLLGVLQLAVVFGIARMFAHQDVFSVDMVVLVTVVGGSSGFSIITAHELIHRRKPWERQFGRLLLSTVLQEHFFTEHLRGHHVRVGLPDDAATARFAESYQAFYLRTVPAQFRNAWQLEKKRLAGRGWVHNRIVQGLVVGWGMALLVGAWAGLAALVAFLLQALFASRLLEAVNYFEHWGLTREGSRVRPRDSWDTHSWFTYYGLTGLSRHADHHYEQTRPYQQLRVQEEVPMLPSGYIAMVDMVMTSNTDFQRLATEELQRCQLGPFAEGAQPAAPEPSAAPPDARKSSVRAWMLGGLVASIVVLVATFGPRIVGDSLPFDALLNHGLWNAWLLGAFVAVFAFENRLEKSKGPLLSWSVALSLLVAVGLVSERLVGLL